MENHIKTGDILLFAERPRNFLWRLLDGGIKFFTGSKFSHSAIALRDPTWIDPELKGLYVWESTGLTGIDDAVDHVEKFGVQVQHFDEYTSQYKGRCDTYVRRCRDRAAWTDEDGLLTLRQIYNDTHGKPYDLWPIDWIEAAVKIGPKKTTKRFWCSAFVTYVLSRMHLVDPRVDWSMQAPQDLSVLDLPAYEQTVLCVTSVE